MPTKGSDMLLNLLGCLLACLFMVGAGVVAASIVILLYEALNWF